MNRSASICLEKQHARTGMKIGIVFNKHTLEYAISQIRRKYNIFRQSLQGMV